MAMRLFLVYALVEVAVLAGLASTIGVAWTLLALLATFAAGLAIAGAQITRHFGRLSEALSARSADPTLATDSVLVALGTVLVVVPGLASSVLGALMLMPWTRPALRPAVRALFSRQLDPMDFPTQVIYINHDERYRGRGEYIDGEVIEVIDSEPVAAHRHAS
ncbi:membrane protein FxsA [Mycobacterium sp. CBMA 234]|uniref:FxsA family protein n=1 Tax=Mycolicibacterium sp. CBMA 234 TaxID=1918495 RepID=UPI0012DCF650|nr:FxsA family protein [Mycolicibacterium sp. CBMA 234]MUL63630.1 membrane protein FxsA [Mycolicibacterium sp. CBMA 234]